MVGTIRGGCNDAATTGSLYIDDEIINLHL